MEKDSDSGHSSSNDTVGENTESLDLEINQFNVHLIARQQQIYAQIMQIKNEMEEEQRKLRHITSLLPHSDTKWPVSPIHEPQDTSKDTFENLVFPPLLEEFLRPDIIYDSCEAVNRAVIQGLNYTSPQKTSDDGTKVDKRDTKFSSPEGSAGSEKSYEGKGKEAQNPKFRYKKRSKPEVSSIEAPSQETPVKLSKEASGVLVTKTPELQSPKATITRISPAVKRKESELDESCATRISKLSENRTDDKDYLKIAKKLKFDDDETISKQCPLIASLLQDRPVSSEYIEQSSIDQSHNESEQLVLPSTSGILRVYSYASSSDESSHFSGNVDLLCSEIEVSSLTSGSEDVTCSDREESSLTSGSE